ncbi:MAG: polymerase subunit epsilon [Thermoplasmata archaeon]|jgi:DNA polymerase-3 subunit epsilon|nr:polymerase subunit epsilon [Thermoplasmata archaeon]
MELPKGYPTRFIALDCETTSMDPATARIVEICLVEVTYPHLEERSRWTTLIKPDVEFPKEAQAYCGITEDLLREAPSFRDVARRIQCILEGAAIIAYNGRRFDVPLLHQELVRAGFTGLPGNQVVIDPYELFLQDSPRNLTAALQHYTGYTHPKAHRAEPDVNAMLLVLEEQLKKRNPADALRREVQRQRVHHFTQDPNGTVRFAFGKHRGQPALHHPDYLRWMLKEPTFANSHPKVVELLDEWKDTADRPPAAA